jgi:hypothetical protein
MSYLTALLLASALSHMHMYRRVVAYTSQILTQGRLLPAEMERKISLDWLRYDELYHDSLVAGSINYSVLL